MLYVSTRGKTDMVSSAHAISSGLAKDGGLFVPRDFPPVALAEIDAMKGKPYGDRAVQILSRYLTDFRRRNFGNVFQLLTAKKSLAVLQRRFIFSKRILIFWNYGMVQRVPLRIWHSRSCLISLREPSARRANKKRA